MHIIFNIHDFVAGKIKKIFPWRETGGGIIIRKLLFAVLLVTGMSLFGIAGASAADTGAAYAQYGHHNTVHKHVHKHVKYYKYSTHKKNKHSHSKFYAKHGSYKHVKSSNSASVNALAHSLTKDTSSQYTKGARVFNWVKHNVRYKFYYNTKYGASGTLKYRTGNCADQAHLVVDLARSAGLPARYVHAKAHFRSGLVYGHYWAKIRANGKWYTADTTSKMNSFGVARNWNSARIVGISNNI